MLVLSFDTSSQAVTAALVEVTDDAAVPVSGRVWTGRHGHSEHLMPVVDQCLTDAGVTVREVKAIVVGAGPGPFTGLRVGLVSAAAMAEALDVPAYEVCSLDGIAPPTGAVLVATDARRKEVYWATYRDGVRVSGPHVDHPSDVDAREATAMAGAGARLYADVLGLPLLDIADHPSPAALVDVAADRIRAGAPSDPLTPLYLRRPDAVVPRAMQR